ncbi:hypothetical protein AZE42_09260 [Rhizopogon vesiculosus]|uniref:DUF6533 domain-containing protein n=1 Tax=Rhizopogon vesiculosus TaxID=180088 RepID=A0A1J8Q4Q5_9AGAM|nr:hypothetical protein AZE42_09260 [Rhizopogon vesiculosus]
MATTVADALALQTVKYTNVAAAGLLIFDYCITFGDEVLWTIGRRWGIPSFMFIMSRYAPFIGATMTAYAGVKSRQGENCIPFNNISNAAHFVGIIGSEVLLLLRTYIFWECSKKFLAVMVPFSVLFSIMAVVFGVAPIPFGIPGSSPACILEGSRSSTLPYGVLLLYELAAHFIGIIASEGHMLLRTYIFWSCNRKFLAVMLPFSLVASILAVVLDTAPISFSTQEVLPPCVLEGSRTSTLPYGVLLLYELVLMALTIFKRYRKYQNLHSSAVKALYRDGVLYMICITLMSIANVVVIAALPMAYSELLNTPQMVIHSVLASRILFNLQDATENRMQETNHLSLSSPYFELRSGIEGVDV